MLDPKKRIQLLNERVSVRKLLGQLDEHPELWNRHRQRTAEYGPHSAISDIWLRYNPTARNAPPIEWYPEADLVPGVRRIATECMRIVGGEELGGILITKIPAGAECKPHRDSGWHAEHYNLKIGVQLKGNKEQAFHFETESVSALPGEIYVFNNKHLHWVTNPSDEDRMTLIIAIRNSQVCLV